MAGMLYCPISGWVKTTECNEGVHVAVTACLDNSRHEKINKDKLN